jgi:hypothetical protein
MKARQRKPAARVPIGLQVSAKLLDGYDREWKFVREKLEAADRHALAIVNDPIKHLEPEGAASAISDLAKAFGSEEPENVLADAIPESVNDPHALITNAYVPWMDAGLYLGLCLGWRLAGALSGKDGAR